MLALKTLWTGVAARQRIAAGLGLSATAAAILALGATQRKRIATAAEVERIMAPLCAVEDDPVEQAIDMRARSAAANWRGVDAASLGHVRERPLDASERADAARWRAANPGP